MDRAWRRRQRVHPPYHKPELLATCPNAVWSWDVSKLKGPVRWSVYHLYVIRLERGSREDLRSFLAENDVQTGIHYPAPIHRTPAFAQFSTQSCPVAERNSQQILSLPMYPELEREQIEHIASLIEEHAPVGAQEITTR